MPLSSEAAITSRRPYKEPIDHQEAVRRITVDRGKHFDPILVDIFMTCEHRFAEVQQQMMDQADEPLSRAAGD